MISIFGIHSICLLESWVWEVSSLFFFQCLFFLPSGHFTFGLASCWLNWVAIMLLCAHDYDSNDMELMAFRKKKNIEKRKD